MYSSSLATPLIQPSRRNLVGTPKGPGAAAIDEDSTSDEDGNVSLSSDYFGDDGGGDTPGDYDPASSTTYSAEEFEFPKRLKWHRRSILWEFGTFGKVKTVLMYLMYVFTVFVTVMYEGRYMDGDATLFAGLGIAGYTFWMCLINTNLDGLFCRQSRIWGGYPYFCLIILNGATATFFAFSFKDQENYEERHPFRYWVLVLMAASLFVDQQIVDPAYYELYLFYHGKVATDESDQPPVTGVNNRVLLRVAYDACCAMNISEEAIESVQAVLKGQRIHEDEERALDDMALVAYKLSKVTSMVPFGCRKGYLNTLQYRNLTRQILMFLRSFKKTGKFSKGAVNQKRTLPLSTYESLKFMGSLTWTLKWSFLFAIIPASIVSCIAPLNGLLTEDFMTGVLYGDIPAAKKAYAYLMAISFIITPILNLCDKFVNPMFTTKLSDMVRKKMLGVVLKGGTQFSETHRGGKLTDAFSNQINQLEIFTTTIFIRLIPNFLGIAASVYVAWGIYPFASILFISMIPIVLSIDYFTSMANRASFHQALTDGVQAGKISSVVECLQAIRSSNAGQWVEENVLPLFANTKAAHYQGFLKSGLVMSLFDAYISVYSLLIFVPLGILVLNGSLDVAVYMGLTTTVTSMVYALGFVGGIQSQVSLFSGSLKVIRDLMDHSLDEEPPSKLPGSNATLAPLSNSLKVSGVNFRYRHDLPNVLSEVKMNMSKGTYTVLCGPSGSGKSSVLNLLMRFREPNEGTVEWDGTDIFGASLESFREQVAVMFQKTMIFQATVRENILFGLPEREIGSVEKAASDAEIHDDILRLPDGYDSVIGGDAIGNMSGGQLQRICLARALYRKPSLLLLDEATSALDAVSEHAIIDTLVRLRDQHGLTLVSVSHHPSTAVKADQIVVLERGVISEEGTYTELMSLDGGIFRGLAEAGNKDGNGGEE